MLQLPTIQNWSCHSCAGCCRQHAIEVTAEEKLRIGKQNWLGQPGFEGQQPVFTWHAGPPWAKRYRLAHREDGACVFLNEQGLCRIHAKFGEPTKPLACRVYPYAFHPAGKNVTVSLRFSCPSVVANRGQTMQQNQSEIRTLQKLVVPPGVEKIPPPPVHPGERLEWPDLMRIVEQLDATLAPAGFPIETKLLQALSWINLVGQSKFQLIQGDRLDEFLALIAEAVRGEIPDDLSSWGPPTSMGQLQFRLLVAQYARRDTAVELRSGWRGRWKLLQTALRFSRGQGMIPVLHEPYQPVPFATLEEPFGAWPPEAEEILTRYFRVKIRGLHFCGRGYYDIPLVEGFQSLALMLPVTLWLARWLAAGAGRRELTTEDISVALATADHHHGFSPAFGQSAFRRRVRQLAANGDLAKLIARYSQVAL